jgi:hypothetical protein
MFPFENFIQIIQIKTWFWNLFNKVLYYNNNNNNNNNKG